MPIIGMIVLLSVVVASLLLIAKCGVRGLLALVGCGLLGLLLLLGWRYASLQTVEHGGSHGAGHGEGVAARSENDDSRKKSQGTDLRDQLTVTPDFSDLSTAAMWEHFTKPKIELNGEAHDAIADGSPEPPAMPGAEQKTEAGQEHSEPRPTWVDVAPKRVGTIYRVAVASGPYRDAAECYRALAPKLMSEVRERLAQLASTDQIPRLEDLGVGIDFVLREICPLDWTESLQQSFGPMKQVHVLMEFNEAADRRLRQALKDYRRRDRITQVGGVAGLSVGSLVLLISLLKIDTWTKGYYTKRLFFGVPAVIIGFVLLNFA